MHCSSILCADSWFWGCAGPERASMSISQVFCMRLAHRALVLSREMPYRCLCFFKHCMVFVNILLLSVQKKHSVLFWPLGQCLLCALTGVGKTSVYTCLSITPCSESAMQSFSQIPSKPWMDMLQGDGGAVQGGSQLNSCETSRAGGGSKECAVWGDVR